LPLSEVSTVQKPFYKPSRDTWYVEVGGKQHSLGRHPEHLPKPKKPARKGGDWNPPPEIREAYHRFMSEPAAAEVVAVAPAPAGNSLLGVFEKFQDWVEGHRKPETAEWYRWRLQEFVTYLKGQGLAHIAVADLKPFHLDDWLAKKKPQWASGTRHGMARAVMRALSWAVKKGHIRTSPVAHYEKPRAGKRKVVLSPERFEEIRQLVNEPFRSLLEVTWETGCRPQESLAVEARHVDLENGRRVFPPDEAKGETWPRVVYLPDHALAITRRLMAEHPTGPLFRNSDGLPWTTDAVNCGFQRLQVALGRKRIQELGLVPSKLPRIRGADRRDLARRRQHLAAVLARRKEILRLAVRHGKKYCLYVLRHSWATHALTRGVDALTVAILLGHRHPGQLASTYQHVSEAPEYLREQARRAAGRE
jgi:integrase